MKHLLFCCVFFVVSFFVVSCKKSKKDIIVGEWIVTKTEFDKNTELTHEDTVDIVDALNMYKTTVYKFLDNDSFKIKSKKENHKGKYEFKNDDKYILLNYGENNSSSRYFILQLDENNLKLRFDQGIPVILTMKVIKKK